MRYVIDDWYDDNHEECTGMDCDWRGGPGDEEISVCPRCGSRLKLAGPPA